MVAARQRDAKRRRQNRCGLLEGMAGPPAKPEASRQSIADSPGSLPDVRSDPEAKIGRHLHFRFRSGQAEPTRYGSSFGLWREERGRELVLVRDLVVNVAQANGWIEGNPTKLLQQVARPCRDRIPRHLAAIGNVQRSGR